MKINKERLTICKLRGGYKLTYLLTKINYCKTKTVVKF